jgi:pimeloyl-ACP methyl ester carboxylesterase
MLIVRRILVTLVLLLVVVYAGLIGYAYWPAGDGVPAVELATAEDRFVDVDGMQIRYRTWGEPEPGEPAIVLIHGFANSVQTFRLAGPLIGEDYYVIALDMPGFGLSDKPDDRDYSNESQARLVGDFIRALGLEQVVIGGHSMGGTHAVHVAVNEPEIVGVIFMNPGIITTGVPAITEYLVFPMPRLSAKTFADRSFRERFVKTSFVRPELITEDVMDELMLGSLTDDYYTGTTQMMSYYVSGDEVGMLDDIRVPVLTVWGRADSRKPESEAMELQELLPGSRLVLVDDAGHYVQEEAPAETAAAIREARGFWAQTR